MITKLLAATALTLTLAGGAFAQTDTGNTGSNEAGAAATSNTEGGSGTTAAVGTTATTAMTEGDQAIFKTWTGPIGQVFFTDDTMATMRTQEEVTTSFASLSAEQQAQVRTDCEKIVNDTTTYSDNSRQLCSWVAAK